MNQTTLHTLWGRLKDDTAFRIGTLYAGGSWFVVEAADTLGARPALVRGIAVVLLGGFALVVGALLLRKRTGSGAEPRPTAPATADAGGDRAASAPPRRAGRRRWAAALAALLAITFGLWAFRTVLGGPVPAAASHVAVLPFHASGSDEVREFGTGMVDVLTAALGDVGGIRTVPARTILARVARNGEPGSLGPDEARALGRAVGAGSVLTGSVTAFGGTVRLTAELRDVSTGVVMARAELDGAQDSIIGLTDRLAMALLRELWRSGTPLPTVRIAGITTASPAALRAYLRGEEHLRALRADSAADSFRQALAVDSTFALAWLRLADAAGWIASGEDVTARRGYTARAVALSQRLPEREASFARGQHLALAGQFAAFDSLADYVRRHPDDPMGWYHLGDVRYHSAYLGRFTDDEIIRPFLESTRLDPALAIGLQHVLDLAVERGDAALFDSASAQYARVAAPERVETLRLQAELRWAPADSVVPRFARMLRARDPLRDRRTANALVGTVGRKARLDPDADPALYAWAMDSLGSIYAGDEFWTDRADRLRMDQLGALGRAADMDAALEKALRRMRMPPGLTPDQGRALVRVIFAMQGFLPHDMVAGSVDVVKSAETDAPFVRDVLRAYYFSKGDAAAAARYPLDPDLAWGPDLPPMDTAALLAGALAYERILQGDTARGLAALDSSILRIGFTDAGRIGVSWYQLGTILVQVPERREEGIRMLRWVTRTWAAYTGEAYLWLGRALEAQGDRDGARDAYGHVLRYWAGADPFRQPALAEARTALARMAAEPR